jgi:hypothetical protein
MQVISGYNHSLGNIQQTQQFRLYHISRPKLREWRQARHGVPMQLDGVDQWIVDTLKPPRLAAVDCAGWYFSDLGIETVCLESDPIGQLYCPTAHYEPDVLTHRPSYWPTDCPTLFKYPAFLKYTTVNTFATFLNIWCCGTIILHFEPRFIKHNHLKYNLIDLIRPRVSFNVTEMDRTVWRIDL